MAIIHCLCLFLLIQLAAPGGACGVSVTPRGTTLTGLSIQEKGLESFVGIPYAEPPIGILRLRPPVLKLGLGVKEYDATIRKPACIQPANSLTVISEACLNINVLRPHGTAAHSLLPVFVWIYGGGFVTGIASNFSGDAIVSRSVERGTPLIYISFDYRVGPLGFPQGEDAVKTGSLNLGLKDQLTALEWVQANIGAFGGDKSKVTVFGESAGAMSIGIHLLRSSFTTLARAAILESGTPAGIIENTGTVLGRDFGNFISSIPACATYANKPGAIDCLRNANLNTSELATATVVALLSQSVGTAFAPNFDGEGGVYPELPSRVYKKGTFAKIPFITGAQLDEATNLIPNPKLVNSDTLKTWLLTNFTPSLLPRNGQEVLQRVTERLLELYPDVPSLGSPFNTGNETFGLDSNFKRVVACYGDIGIQSQRRILQQAASANDVRSYGYLFTDPQPQDPKYFGVSHGRDIPYVFHTPFEEFGDCAQKSAASQVLCDRVLDYWLSFATSLTPNDGKGVQRPIWKPYTTKAEVLIRFDGDHTEMIPDSYRRMQIQYIIDHAAVFHR